MKGLVIKSTGSWYQVLGDDGQIYECRVPGKFRTKGVESTNPIAVGDKVVWELEPEQQTGIITKLEDRENYIIRRSTNLSHQSQIIAANMDQAILVITLAQPRTSLGFIDRFLVTAEAYHIPVILAFNKFDLYSDESLVVMRKYEALYTSLGYSCIELSGLTGFHLDELKQIIKNKTSLFSGHSGVGKSTLINQLIPGLALKTLSISDSSSKGKHSTTFAEMHPLPSGGFIIDTPGIKELGVVDIPKEEIAHYFPEIRAELNNCKFHNCMHLEEPHCAVTDAVRAGKIAMSRYESYLSILSQGEERRR